MNVFGFNGFRFLLSFYAAFDDLLFLFSIDQQFMERTCPYRGPGQHYSRIPKKLSSAWIRLRGTSRLSIRSASNRWFFESERHIRI